ncbi:MAG: sensor domain-containing diguanylate cyclase [Propionivibrio sp.]
MRFSLVKNLLPKSQEPALAFAALAQAGIAAAILLSLAFVGTEAVRTASVALLLVACLLLANAGLIGLHLRFRRIRESSRRLRLLANMNVQVNREILLNENIELIYRTILDYLFNIFNTVNTGSILILGDDGYLTFAASRGFTEKYVQGFRLKLEDAFLYQETKGQIMETRLITSATLARLVTMFEPGDWKYNAVISAPIFVGNRLFGILNLDSDLPGTFHERDTAIVERFRAQIEVCLLAREQYRADIERYHVDALTGLFTRRYFEDLFAVSLDHALHDDGQFVVAIFDVDRLKYVNDTFGHLAGDQMLLTIASAIRASCRKSDIIGRFGGDEFVALYHTSEKETMERNIAGILSALRNRNANFGDKEFRLSFSYGLARFPEDGNSLETLTAVADGHLYAMKSEHRNAR